MGELRVLGQACLPVQKGVERSGGQASLLCDVEHEAFPRQSVHACLTNHSGDGFMVRLANEEPFHTDHRASHDRVLVKASHGKGHVSTAAGDGKVIELPASIPNIERSEAGAYRVPGAISVGAEM